MFTKDIYFYVSWVSSRHVGGKMSILECLFGQSLSGNYDMTIIGESTCNEIYFALNLRMWFSSKSNLFLRHCVLVFKILQKYDF